MSLIQIKKGNKTYHNKILFNDLDFKLDQGEKIALIGENGTGKTTLCRILVGLDKLDSGNLFVSKALSYAYLSQNLEENKGSNLAWQDERWLYSKENLEKWTEEYGKNPCPEYANFYQEALYQFELAGGYEYKQNLAKIIPHLSLPNDILDRAWNTLSGGEKMRLTLAKKILLKSDLLILDEPTNHLDIFAIDWLITYLKSFKGSLIIVSHDRFFVNQLVSRCIFLENKKIRSFPGNLTEALDLKKEEDEFNQKKLKSLEKELKREKEITQTLLSHRNISGYHSRERRVANLEKRLIELEEKNKKIKSNFKIKIRNTLNTGSKEPLFTINDLEKSFFDKILLQKSSFTCYPEDKIAIIGISGSGKSTLLKMLIGEESFDAGNITLKANLKFAYMTQNVIFLDETISVFECLAEVLEDKEKTLAHLASFGFYNQDVDKKIEVLSGGERSRLYLSLILLENPDLIFLDEPTNHLDFYTKDLLINALQNYRGSVILISHDRNFITSLATRYILLSQYRLQEYADFDTLDREYRAKLKENNDKVNLVSASSENSVNKQAYQDKKINNLLKRRKVAELKNLIKLTEEALKKVDELLSFMQQEVENQESASFSQDFYLKMHELTEERERLEHNYIEKLLELENYIE